MTDPEEPWTGDVNEAVVEEWVEETTPFERVESVLSTTTAFQYAGEIAERARVSEPSARKHLRILAEAGLADTETAGQGTRYRRSRASVAMRRLRELHTRLTRDELVDGIRDTKRRIQSLREEHDATGPDDLALTLEPGDDWTVVSEWRALEEDLQLAQAALALYDFDPDDADEPADDASRSSGSGAFADDSCTV